MRHPFTSAGFTLLEAIVALTVLGITLVPVMTFLGNAAGQISAAAESNRRAAQQEAAAAFLAALNPLITPSGEAELSPQVVLKWSSTPIVSPNSGGNLGGRMGNFRVAFFMVDVAVTRNEQDWINFSARKMGYEPVTTSISGMPGQ